MFVAAQAFLSFQGEGLSLVAVRRLLPVAAPLVAEHRLSGVRASVAVAPRRTSCSAQA